MPKGQEQSWALAVVFFSFYQLKNVIFPFSIRSEFDLGADYFLTGLDQK